ncbi:MAG TPA: lysylphosphatidylglycerol synthase transmembrane domain-containing protein [Anaerolineales bacterium]|nr:lysylphosphatidylglycerol synthase transmembrane domain-containing protein [Anaerolineales bacterium]
MTQAPESQGAKPSRKMLLLRTAGSLLALALLIYLLSKQGWDEILVALRQIPVSHLLLALGLMFVSRLAVVGRWHVLLTSSGFNISYWQSLRITFAGLFASNFLPTTIGGDVVRLAGAVQNRQDPAVAAASLIVDRLVGMAGMLLAVPFSLAAVSRADIFNNLPSSSRSIQILSLGLWAPIRKIYLKALGIVKRLFDAAGIWLRQPRSLLISLGFTWINMLCLFGILDLLLGDIDKPVSYWLIGGLYALVYFFTLIPISINGYGLQEVSMTFLFTQVAGVPLSSALTAAVLFRTLMMVTSLPGAVFVPGMLTRTPESTDISEA